MDTKLKKYLIYSSIVLINNITAFQPLDAFAQVVVLKLDRAGNRVSREMYCPQIHNRIHFDKEDREFEEISEGISVSIGPNPVVDMLHISIRVNNEIHGRIKIYSMSGQLILNKYITDDMIVDMSSKQNGMYILQINVNDNEYSRKIIKE